MPRPADTEIVTHGPRSSLVRPPVWTPCWRAGTPQTSAFDCGDADAE